MEHVNDLFTSRSFTAILGFQPGYDHDDGARDADDNEILDAIALAWDEEARKLAGGRSYVTAVFTVGRAQYPHAPRQSGETVVVATGDFNPYFGSSVVEWRDAAVDIVLALRERFSQSSATITFVDAMKVYVR